MRRRQIPLCAMTLAVLAGLYVAMRPDSLAGPAAAADVCSTHATGTGGGAATLQRFGRVARVSVDAPDPVAMTVRQGDVVSLDVASSRAGEVTVHGLSDAAYAVTAGQLAHLRFPAAQPGLYAVHFHSRSGEHVPLAQVSIQPR